jgi:hypothetical protein
VTDATRTEVNDIEADGFLIDDRGVLTLFINRTLTDQETVEYERMRPDSPVPFHVQEPTSVWAPGAWSSIDVQP